MALLVGIDEAGYGPTLGPLVIASSAWRIPRAAPDIDLWHMLRDAVSRDAGRGQWRIVVDDSKRVFDRKKGLGSLERSVHAFLSLLNHDTADVARMLGSLGAPIRESWLEAPWYRDLQVSLPIDVPSAASPDVRQKLADTLAQKEIACTALRAEIVPEHLFNHRLSQTHNKSHVLIEHVLRLIDRAVREAEDEELLIVVDRLGGRDDYRGLLMSAFPDRDLHILRVDDQVSQYRLTPRHNTGHSWQIRFQVEADQTCLPVGLASMTAKYVRELLMACFNQFWQSRNPSLRPTAGYYTDAQRFLREIAECAAAAGIDMQRFTRQR